jgi:hypothetical protein
MSTWQASAIALALYAVASVPLAFVAVRRDSGVVAVALVALVIAVCLINTGVFARSSLAPTDSPIDVSLTSDGPRCAEILRLMKRSGWKVDRSDPASPKIVGPGADQIPDQVVRVVIGCELGRAVGAAADDRLEGAQAR